MRAWFLGIVIGILVLGASAAYAQSVKPKYPREIKAASTSIAERNEDCRRQAREQHLHLVKRYRFMRDCKRQRQLEAPAILAAMDGSDEQIFGVNEQIPVLGQSD